MQLRDLQLGRAASKLVTFTRTTAKGQSPISVLVTPLTVGDLQDAMRSTVSGNQQAAILARTLRDPEKPDCSWATEQEIATLLTQREVSMLIELSAQHQAEVSPALRNLSLKQFEDLLHAIEGETGDLLVGFRVSKCLELQAYYGEPAVKLTDGQVLFFLGVLRAEAKRTAKESLVAAAKKDGA